MKFYPERQYPRFEFSQFPWVLAIELTSPAWSDCPLRMEGKNISRGGIKLLSNRKIELFSKVRVSLFDRKSGQALASATGKVVRLEEINTGLSEITYGIALQLLEDPLQKLLPASAPSSG